VPSVFITQMSKSPSRSLSKAMRAPSGDHDGLPSEPGSVVSWSTAPVCTSIRYRSRSPPRSLTKAIVPPAARNRSSNEPAADPQAVTSMASPLVSAHAKPPVIRRRARTAAVMTAGVGALG
jgi:hypothetical protein